MGDLTKNFDRSEFACQCGCGFDNIDKRLVDVLQYIRNVVGPIRITSGCRCPYHNHSVGGNPTSAHMSGLAADILCISSKKRWEIIDTIFDINAVEHHLKGIFRIGIGGDFIHIDIDESKPTPRIWTY
jgi:uncharacterized protein YcbK (DUF882 family)